MATINKQPYEVFTIEKDFAERMADGEIIDPASSDVLVFNSERTDVTTNMIESGTITVDSNTILQAVIKGGTDKQRYKVSFRAYISDTKKLEEDDDLLVRD